jgi:prevent-host-death family protein
MAIYSGYNGIRQAMDVSVADAKNRLSELLRSVEDGENVVITRNGKPVAQLIPPPPRKRVVRFGTMRGRIHLKPGWDDPIDIDQFLAGRF